MIHTQFNSSKEYSQFYPALFHTDQVTTPFRIIICKDNIQLICQQYKKPYWRSISFHYGSASWQSILNRWSKAIDALPIDPPTNTPERFYKRVTGQATLAGELGSPNA